MIEIQFKADTIRLKDLLKATDLLPSGGMAKHVIRDQGVLLNGEECFIPGKQVHKGDQVVFDDNIIKLI